MAEQEITKHTKKVYKVWTSKEHSTKTKLKDFFVEIAIIIFAVTISIWFHSLSQKRHDAAEVKQYFIGLKGDLEKDVQEMQSDTMSYGQQKRFFHYLSNIAPAENLDTNVVKEFDWIFQNTTVLIPNVSRFEALKYSGLMGKIENKDLLDEILNLNEETIPMLVKGGNTVSDLKIATIGKQLDGIFYARDRDFKQLNTLVKTDKEFLYNLQKSEGGMGRVYREYILVLKQYEKLIKMIEAELK
jgi:hypothetical protein